MIFCHGVTIAWSVDPSSCSASTCQEDTAAPCECHPSHSHPVYQARLSPCRTARASRHMEASLCDRCGPRVSTAHPLSRDHVRPSYGVPSTAGWRYLRHRELWSSRRPRWTAAVPPSTSPFVICSRTLCRRRAARVVPVDVMLQHCHGGCFS